MKDKPGKHVTKKEPASVQSATGQTVGDAPLSDGGEKWTPGPWNVERGNYGEKHTPFLVVVSPNAPYATSATRYSLRPWSDADAHLIAAAPDLYAALEAATNALETTIWKALHTIPEADDDLAAEISEHVVVKQARAALAKAKGESDAG